MKRARNAGKVVSAGLLTLLILSLIGCNGSGDPAKATSEVRIQGAGATFPNVMYQKWFSEYNKSHPNVKFDYESLGSGAGIKQITEQTVDFGGSDAPMNDDQLKAASKELVHIPTVLGADVLTYNVPGVEGTLKLTGETIANIFLGKITKWNDPALVAINPGAKLPANDIVVCHRSDGSGTTFVFTDYLSKVSPDWKEKAGAGTSIQWPVGNGAKGNEGVTQAVKASPNTIGYVELIYAEQNKLPYASVKNSSGEFITASLDSVSAAAAGVAGSMPADLRVSITNSPGKDAYPISSFTYIIIYKDEKDQAKGKAMVDFLWWATHDGQALAPGLLFAKLPPEVVTKNEEKIKGITFQGTPLYKG